MLSIKEKGLLLNIIGHCQKIENKTSSISQKEFIKNEDIIEIVCFNLLQIGELAKNFDDSFVKKYDKMPWKQIKGMRDKVAHGYGTIDFIRVWNTAIIDIRPLKDYCQEIIKVND